jgi:hypothetical protein
MVSMVGVVGSSGVVTMVGVVGMVSLDERLILEPALRKTSWIAVGSSKMG